MEDMSTAAERPRGGSVPQSGATAEELRAALVRIAPGVVATFDAERATAVALTSARAREQGSSAPVCRFLRQWALYVAIERHPGTAARLRLLEDRAAHVTEPDEARAIASELGRILDTAAAEAGVPCGGAQGVSGPPPSWRSFPSGGRG
ncbi:hypothetical protein ABZY31_10920 [Streptomyces sp. NPDC006529]|uniref:hypothetical protein n=1 Tax=Streptomyces sp. NPDC006529 TaxID=3157177 RepID=UPI0033B077A0